MKKTICAVLIMCVMLCGLVLPAAAEQDDGVIRIKLNSDIAGCTKDDHSKLIEILSPQVTFYYDNSSPIHISNAAGASEEAHLDAGRSYYIIYTLDAAEGYSFPETLSDGDIEIECGKGVSLISYDIIKLSTGKTPDPSTFHPLLRVRATVVVDGSAIQRIIGWFRDLVLRIRSWQLY